MILEQRSRGFRTALVQQAMDVARDQGYEIVYASTISVAEILERSGWIKVRESSHAGARLIIFGCDLA